MIEVNWGETITLYAPKYKKIEHFRTIEKAQYWLRCKWPEMTAQRSEALLKTQLAMDCLIPVGEAKNALLLPHTRPVTVHALLHRCVYF